MWSWPRHIKTNIESDEDDDLAAIVNVTQRPIHLAQTEEDEDATTLPQISFALTFQHKIDWTT